MNRFKPPRDRIRFKDDRQGIGWGWAVTVAAAVVALVVIVAHL